MRNRMKIGLAAASFAALGLVAAGGGLFTAAAQTEGFSEGQVKSIEKIVKDYLLSHPEVLTEVQDAYERKVEAQRADVTRAHLPVFYKALANMKAGLDSMSVGSGDVTVIEFFDYNCGYCRRTLPDLVKLVENEPNIKVQFMEYPILAPSRRTLRGLPSPRPSRANTSSSTRQCSSSTGHRRTPPSRLPSSLASIWRA